MIPEDITIPCDHPMESRFDHLNLFTGKSDEVCSLCNATVIPDVSDLLPAEPAPTQKVGN